MKAHEKSKMVNDMSVAACMRATLPICADQKVGDMAVEAGAHVRRPVFASSRNVARADIGGYRREAATCIELRFLKRFKASERRP